MKKKVDWAAESDSDNEETANIPFSVVGDEDDEFVIGGTLKNERNNYPPDSAKRGGDSRPDSNWSRGVSSGGGKGTGGDRGGDRGNGKGNRFVGPAQPLVGSGEPRELIGANFMGGKFNKPSGGAPAMGEDDIK